MSKSKVQRIESLPPSPVEGMSRGTKSMWLRQHRDIVFGCRDVFGDDWVCHFFCMLPKTLEALISNEPRINRSDTMAKSKDIEVLTMRMGIIQTELAELRKNQRDLEQLFNQFVESTGNQISKALIIPLLRNVFRFEGNLPDTIDPLSVDKLLAQARAHQR